MCDQFPLIPLRDWQERPLSEVGDVVFSNVDKKSRFRETEIRLCNYLDVYLNDYVDDGLPYMKATASAAEIRKFALRTGDVIITKDSETPDDIGVATIVRRIGPDVLCGYHLARIRLRKSTIPDFVAKQIGTDRIQRYFAKEANGTTRYGLSNASVKTIPLWLPKESDEQRRIAEILDTLDEAIRRTEQVIAKLQQMKQGLLHDLLTRGIDENGELRDPERHPEQFQDSLLGRIPKGWEVRPLASGADIDRGKFTHRPRNDPRFYGGNFPFIQTGDISAAEGGILTSYTQTLNDRGASVSKEFPANTIAITIAANIADTAILGIPMHFPDSVVGAVVRHPNNIRFIELSLRRSKAQLEAQAPQSAQKNINLQDLRPLPTAFPDPVEQDLIAKVYDSHSECLDRELTQVEKLRTLKQGLMDDLLTGRVRVPVPEEAAS